MARVCSICGKKPKSVFVVSHSNRHVKARQLPNLFKKKILTARGLSRGYICSKCLKAHKALA